MLKEGGRRKRRPFACRRVCVLVWKEQTSDDDDDSDENGAWIMMMMMTMMMRILELAGARARLPWVLRDEFFVVGTSLLTFLSFSCICFHVREQALSFLISFPFYCFRCTVIAREER